MITPKHIFVVVFVFLATAATTAAATLSQRHRESFADKFTSILYNDMKDDENHCTSSLGVSMVMSLVYPTMTEGAAKEVEDVFGYSDDESLLASITKSNAKSSSLQWSTVTNQLRNSKCDDDKKDCNKEKPTVVISNSVWTQEGRQLRTEYNSILLDGADEDDTIKKSIDLTDTVVATKAINTWVSDATNGLIEEIVDGSPLPELFAINTIYFKASWKNPFMKYLTNRDVFYHGKKSSSTTTETSFMHQVEYFRHHVTANHHILELPFHNGRGDNRIRFATYLVLPHNDNDKTSTLLSSSDLVDTITDDNKLVSQRIALALPKFKISSTYKNDVLKPILIDMGITQALSSPSMCVYTDDNCSSQITDIIQKTFINVDEEGMEAAAVSAMGIRLTSAPTDVPTLFVADHPFQFFVYDKTTDVVLFEGIVRDPNTFVTSEEEQQEEKLKARHSDVDFWKNNFGVLPQQAAVPDIDVDDEEEMENQVETENKGEGEGEQTAQTKLTSASTTTFNKLPLMTIIASTVGGFLLLA